MLDVPSEILTSFVVKQGQIWQSVALYLSEQNGVAVEIPMPTAEAVPMAQLSELNANPVLHAWGSFQEQADEPTLFVVGEQPSEREAAEKALFEAVLGQAPDTVDETALGALREFFAHLMQGLAIAFGNLRQTQFTPAAIEPKREPIVFPPNFLGVDEFIAVRLTIQIPDRTPISLTWLLTSALAAHLIGVQLEASDPIASFAFEEAPTTAAPTAQTTPMPFNPFGEVEEADSARNLDLLLDIPLEVSVELGRVNLLVSELLEIGTGSIIELKKVAGEPVEVLVNGRLIARGEVVVVEDNFAVRITEILSPMERVQRLGA
jgi:flagellar motor switch protein FliN/FliY